MDPRILFIGAGAIGSYLGAFLARSGRDVTLVDPWAEQVETIRTRGVVVTGPHDPFEVRLDALHVHEAQRLGADFDIGVVAVKAYDTAWATQLALRHLRPAGFLVAAQNCWTDPVIAALAGPGRAVGLVMSRIAVALWRPGQVERGAARGSASSHVVFRVGEHDGSASARTAALAAMLSVIDRAEPTANLWGERWAKLCQNAMGNPVQAMTGLGSSEIAAMPPGREITVRLAQESVRVGRALGLRIPAVGGLPAERWTEADEPATYGELDALLGRQASADRNWRASMAQDVIKGRRSEIEEMNGLVVAKGREVNVATPVSAAVVDIMREIDAGRRRPTPEHIERALGRRGG